MIVKEGSGWGTSSESVVWHDALTEGSCRLIGVPICPDLLDYGVIGAADNMRGRVVRTFFWLMRIWPT